MRPLTAHISLPAIAHNLRHIQNLHRGKKVLAVLKCNAYGHDACAILPALAGAEGIAVVEFPLADALRRAGWQKPIVMLEGFFDDDDLFQAQQQQLDLVVHNHWQLTRLLDCLPRFASAALRVWLKMNSGMNRLGFAVADYRVAYQSLSLVPQVREIVHMSHFANADNLSPSHSPSLSQQYQVFMCGIEGLDGAISMANSAACLRADYAACALHTRNEWLRPGIALYGASPYPYQSDTALDDGGALGLQSSHCLVSTVLSVQHCVAGDTVGYGSHYVATADTTVAIIAAGYGDGYPRVAGGIEVALRGQLCPLVGRVSMDMLAVDVSALEDVAVGEAVLLWGTKAGLGRIAVERVAAAGHTIAYDVLCRVHPRVARVWQGL